MFSIKLQLNVTLQARDNAYYIIWLKNNFNTLYITYIASRYLGNLNFLARPRNSLVFISRMKLCYDCWIGSRL